jgi:hypothetical protein
MEAISRKAAQGALLHPTLIARKKQCHAFRACAFKANISKGISDRGAKNN